MTISSVTSKVVYVGDESTTVFPYPFKALAATDLVATRYHTATGSSDVLVLNTNYLVSGVGIDAGGNVTLTGNAAAVSSGSLYVHTGCQLVIQRSVPLTQTVDYVANDAFPAETHEGALDRLCMADQQIQEQLNRCIKADITQTTGNTTYVEVVGASVAASASSAAVCVSAATGAVDVTVSVAGNAANAAASAVLASLSAASVSSGVTAALDNLTPTSVNLTLKPGTTLSIDLGSAAKRWSSSYVSLLSGSSLDIGGTANIVTLRSTLLTSSTLNVSGTANVVTISSNYLDVSTTANITTVRSTLLSSATLNVSGTTNAVTLATALLTATTVKVSGTGSFTTVSGDGSLLTGLNKFKTVPYTGTTGNLTVAHGLGKTPTYLIICALTDASRDMLFWVTGLPANKMRDMQTGSMTTNFTGAPDATNIYLVGATNDSNVNGENYVLIALAD